MFFSVSSPAFGHSALLTLPLTAGQLRSATDPGQNLNPDTKPKEDFIPLWSIVFVVDNRTHHAAPPGDIILHFKNRDHKNVTKKTLTNFTAGVNRSSGRKRCDESGSVLSTNEMC